MSNATSHLTRLGWGLLVVTCIVYGLYALDSGVSELLFVLGLGPEIKHRAAPILFVAHSVAGAIALLAGPFQFSARLRRRVGLHRAVGYAYVVGVGIAGTCALAQLPTFDVEIAGKIVFGIIAVTWLGTTTVGVRRVLARRIIEHREWMVRSFALTLFFVSFTLWVPLLAATELRSSIAYPLALGLSGGINLAVAEIWIRGTRRPVRRARRVARPSGRRLAEPASCV